eukprot:108708-Pleurochrysis_carterae.AAC.1
MPMDVPDARMPDGCDTSVKAAPAVVSTTQPNEGDERSATTVDTPGLRQRVLIDGAHGDATLHQQSVVRNC